MWRLNKKMSAECERVCDALESTAPPESRGEIVAAGTLLARLPESSREHVYSCEGCRAFAEELLEARELLGAQGNKTEPGPFFLARVMAAIASKEAELEQSAQTWAAVPRLASRLTVLASLGLLIAASWVYEMPRIASSAGWNSQQWAGLVDTSAVQDDLLVSPASK
jgi:hypothetical protein